MKKKILITGACSFLGIELALKLNKKLKSISNCEIID